MSDTADAETRQPTVSVHARFVPPAEPSLPPLALQATRLVGSYMVWVGTTEETAESVKLAPLRGSLTRDWTCAMPPTSISAGPGAATTLHRSSSSDVSFAMAQRLGKALSFLCERCARTADHADGDFLGPFTTARRFRKQIFLSVDVPPSFMALGDGPRLVLAVEKAVVDTLKSLEETGQVPAP